MYKPSQWRSKQGGTPSNGSQPLDFNILNQHGRKINAEADRLQRDRDNLIQQRTQTSNKAQSRSRQNPSYGSSDYFNRQGYGGKTIPETIPEESSRKYKQSEAVERVENVKGLIDQLVQDSKIESEEVKIRLRNIQQKQQELLNDMENYSPKFNDNRPTGLYQTRPTKYTVAQEDEELRRPYSDYPVGGEARKAYQFKDEVAEFAVEPAGGNEGIAYSSDPLSGLSALQGRIVDEIMSLREKNIKLMKTVNAETKNFNELLTDYKKLEQENARFRDNLASTANQVKSRNTDLVADYRRLEEQNAKLKDHLNNIAEELNSIRQAAGRGNRGGRAGRAPASRGPGAEAEQNSYLARQLEKLQRQNQALREKMRKKSTFGSRHDDQDLKEENTKLRQGLKAARADAQRLQLELSQRQTAYTDDERLNRQAQAISDLKNQLYEANQEITKLRAENRRLEGLGRGGGEIQAQLDKLKYENERLRKETIDLLHQNAGSTRNRDNERYRASQGFSYGSYNPF